MPLPWLIGIAAVTVGAAIVAAVKSDDTSSSSSASSGDEERRRREAAAQQQRKDEQKKKRENARVLFKERGTQIGAQLAGTLDGWAELHEDPAFAAKLTSSGYSKRPQDQVVPHQLGNVINETFSATDEKIGQVMRDLDFFNEVYDVHLRGHTRLYTTLMEVQSIDKELSELEKLRKKLERIRKDSVEAAPKMAETAK